MPRATAAVLAVPLLFAACVIDTTEADLLEKLYECDTEADCVDGWACRPFGLDATGRTYCVKPCASGDNCRADELCGNEGFCVAACDLADPVCPDEQLACLRLNMAAGETAGYCQPTVPCSGSADCGSVQDQCVAELLEGVYADLTLETTASACVESCGDLGCTEGFVCAADVASQYTELTDLPPICVPKCGVDNACPNGLQCLIDALRLLLPGENLDELVLKFCVPGLPTVVLPCQRDLDCLLGHCVRHPTRYLDGGAPLHTCALPCTASSTCEDGDAQCLPTERDDEPVSYCFPP